MPRYNPAQIEPKWQAFWQQNQTFRTPRLPAGEKLYVLDMFPYPSGDGLHVGHPEGYTATDIVCRLARMQGKSVMHPMGFDAFGLPAEEHAIKTNTPPRESTDRNMATFRRQLQTLGFSYDWQRELATTDLAYFRWTQWIFLQIYDTYFDAEQQKGRPISQLPIPDEVREQGPAAIGKYQDSHRLAYQHEAPVNWCAALGTVLANEEVQGGVSERGGHPVTRVPLRQWMLRITAYADRLEQDLDPLDWSDSIKSLQRNWIGRSTGAEVDFFIGAAEGPNDESFAVWKAARAKSGFAERPADDVLRVYTTRPDTLFGATYMVIAPEHPFVDRLTTADQKQAVESYRQAAASKSDLDRTELAKHKTGVFTGSHAVNPVSGAKVPVWVADYVLMSYGTGAIMAVPAHDDRDFEFAKTFEIPILAVVDPGDNNSHVDRQQVLTGEEVFTSTGVAVNSGSYDGLTTAEFKKKIADDLQAAGQGRRAVNYKLRDWLFSRQRFWGEPFPILHELDEHGNPTGTVRAVAEDQLPVDLPKIEDYKPHGRADPPLDKAPREWLYPVIDGVPYKRETNTMPQWAGSCWYYLRYLDPKNDQALIDPRIEKAWMPVDLYIGGAEHAVLHLLYARFWHKVLYDRGVVSTAEPFQKLINQGMILGELEITGYQDAGGHWISAKDVRLNENKKPVVKAGGQEVTAVKVEASQAVKQGDSLLLLADKNITLDSRAYKMSKSRGNVINPDAVVAEYGADALRLYEMFMGPLEAAKPWSMDGVSGVYKFLDRLWRLIADARAESLKLNPAVQTVEPTDEQARVVHKTIKAVTGDLHRLACNTAIARMMEFTNYFTKQTTRPRWAMEQIVLLIAPLAPHLAEELWQLLGHDESLAYHPWPKYDDAFTQDETIEVPVQINGKLRARLSVAADVSRDDLEAEAKTDAKIASLLAGKTIVKAVVIPGRLVNFVVK